MNPAPTDVVLKLEVGENAMPIALTADSKESNRFASSPGVDAGSSCSRKVISTMIQEIAHRS